MWFLAPSYGLLYVGDSRAIDLGLVLLPYGPLIVAALHMIAQWSDIARYTQSKSHQFSMTMSISTQRYLSLAIIVFISGSIILMGLVIFAYQLRTTQGDVRNGGRLGFIVPYVAAVWLIGWLFSVSIAYVYNSRRYPKTLHIFSSW
jgi:hypothetical protein